MNTISNVSFRIDSDLKKKADALFASLGINMTAAFNMFLRQSVREGRIPFDMTIDVPNQESIAAIIEAMVLANDPKTESHDVEDALRQLKS